MVAVAGNISEAMAIIDWRVTATKCKDGSLSGTTTTNGTSYSVTCVDTDPVNLTLHPKIDYQWTPNRSVLVGDYVVAANPDGTPHIWVATTAPAGGDQYFSNVKSLLHFNGDNNSTTIVDSSGSPMTLTANGSAKITTADSVFGGSCLDCGVSGSNYISSSTSIVLGTNDFIFEGRFKPAVTGDRFFYMNGVNKTGGIGLAVSQNNIIFRAAGTSDLTYQSTISGWKAVAFIRFGNSRMIAIDGVIVASGALSFNQTESYAFQLGGIGYLSSDFHYFGLIDEFRITTATPRHIENYSLDAAEFPNTGQVKTGSSEPAWNLSGTTNDAAGIVWTYVAPLVDPVTIGPKIPA
jgi:hypothetical protein